LQALDLLPQLPILAHKQVTFQSLQAIGDKLQYISEKSRVPDTAAWNREREIDFI